MCTCVHIYCVRVRVFVRVCVCVCVDGGCIRCECWMYTVRVLLLSDLRACMYVYLYVYVCLCVYLYVHMCVCVYVYVLTTDVYAATAASI